MSHLAIGRGSLAAPEDINPLVACVTATFPDIPTELVRWFEYLVLGTEIDTRTSLKRLEKPYGENLILRIVGDYGFSVATMLPGRTTSYHQHTHRRELFAVRRGTFAVHYSDRTEILTMGDIGTSSPGFPHRLENIGVVDGLFVEIFSPPLLDDKIRFDDRYGRRLGNVQHRD